MITYVYKFQQLLLTTFDSSWILIVSDLRFLAKIAGTDLDSGAMFSTGRRPRRPPAPGAKPDCWDMVGISEELSKYPAKYWVLKQFGK